MKTLGIFMILFSLASPQIGLANYDGSSKADVTSEKKEDTQYHSLGKQIHDHVKYPLFLIAMEIDGSSQVRFKINDDQTISVLDVYGINSKVNSYVKQQLQNKSVLVPQKQLGKIYEVTINFYLI